MGLESHKPSFSYSRRVPQSLFQLTWVVGMVGSNAYYQIKHDKISLKIHHKYLPIPAIYTNFLRCKESNVSKANVYK